MQRAIIIITLILLSFGLKAQVYQSMPQAGYGPVKRMLFDSVLTLPLSVFSLRNISGGRDVGQIRWNTPDSSLYMYSGSQWIKINTDTSQLSNRIANKLSITDTSSMLSSYLRKVDTASLSNRIDLRVKYTDTASMFSAYHTAIKARIKYTDSASMLAPYLRKLDTLSLSNRINKKQDTLTLTTTGTSGPSTLTGSALNIPNYGSNFTNYVPYVGAFNNVDLGVYNLTADFLFAKGSLKVQDNITGTGGTDNYTSIQTKNTEFLFFSQKTVSSLAYKNVARFLYATPNVNFTNDYSYNLPVRNGTLALVEDTVSLSNRINAIASSDTTSLSNRINLKLNISDTASMLTPYLRKADTSSLSNRINLLVKYSDTAAMLSPYLKVAVTSVGLSMPSAFTVTNSPVTSTGSLTVTGAGNNTQLIDGTGALQTIPTGLPPTGNAGGDLTGTYPNPTVHKIHGVDMQSGTPAADDTWVYGGSPAKWQHKKLHSNQVTEDGNLFYTEARVDANTNVAANTAARHNALTIGTANGLTLFSQVLTLGTASTTNTGALTSADWNTFNGKGSVSSVATGLGLSGGTITTSGTLSVDTSSASILSRQRAANTYYLASNPNGYNTGTVTSVATGLGLSGGTISTSGTLLVDTSSASILSRQRAAATYQTAGTYVTSVTGTSPIVSSGGITPAISIPAATSSVNGYLSSTDWTTFNGKMNYSDTTSLSNRINTKGSGTVTSVSALTLGTTGTDLSSTVANSTTTPVITLNVPTASASNRGALSSADWSTFNGKESALTFSSPLVRTINTISIPVATTSVNGYLSSTDWTTFNNKYNLPSLTSGSVLFSNGTTIAQDNSNFYWDDTNNRLGIGTTSPASALTIASAGELRAYRSDNTRYGTFYTDNLAVHIASSNDPVRITSADRTEFYNSGTERMRISTGGVITIANLANTGSRAVLADASGVLSAPVSDSTVKQNIKKLDYGIADIMKLKPVSFEYIDSYKNYGQGKQIGNIAQDMANVIPEAVFTTPSTGKMGINYEQLNGVYIKALQELQEQINILKLEIQTLIKK